MVRLTRFRIDRFRNVKPGTELHFGPTFNVLLGKNATGKSTLLDLIAAITNDDLSAYASEDAGFDLTWWLESDEDQVELRAARTPAQSIAVPERMREERELDDVWSMLLRTAGVETGRLEVAGTRGIWKPAGSSEVSFDVRAGLATGGAFMRALTAISFKHQEQPARIPAVVHDLAARRMLGLPGDAGRFDEALTALQAITGSFLRLTRGRNRSRFSFSLWLPEDLVWAIDKQASFDPLVVSFGNVGSLAEIPGLLGFVSAEVHPRVVERSNDGDKVKLVCGGFDCLFRRADGSQISHERLSFGQKRLLSFLWYHAAKEERPIIADELLNGLHHDWIEVCFERLRERQSFLATQHPLLLDHIPVDSAEAVLTTFVRCSLEVGRDGREQVAWRNFNEEEAGRFFVAYQTGIQQVSEILRTEGLW